MRKSFRLILTALFSSCLLSSCGSDIRINDLRCEYLSDPLAIDNTSPTLSWKMTAKENGSTSTAYQILAATDPALLNEDKADLWNSGKVGSPDVIKTKYSGKALESKDMVYWKVRIWDQNDKPSAWSRPAEFGIGFLNEDDWAPDASYIGIRQRGGKDAAVPFLRTTFNAVPKDRRILLHVNSLGFHEAYVNGLPVSDAVLSPAVSEFDKRSLIVTYDVTDLVRKGSNELVIWTGQGWYQTIADGVVPDGPYVRAQLEAVSSEGTEILTVTDNTWKAAESSRRTFGSWGYRKPGGETVDSRNSIPDMKKETLDMLRWEEAVVADIPAHKASPQMCELNRITAQSHPVAVYNVADSVYVYDMGSCSVGFTEVMMPVMEDGKRIELHYEDLYLKDMADFRDGTYKDYYIGNDRTTGRFSSRFNYKAYRYLKIKGLPAPLPLSDITRSSIRTDYESEASFSCSDKDMNDIYQMIHKTVHELTLGGYMVDCPHRERLGYGGDGNASTPFVQTMADAAPLYMNWIQAYADSQSENGDMPHTGPNPYRAGGGPFWCTFIIPASWYAYVNYGDTRFIERYYPNMQKWIEFAESNYKDGLLKEWGQSPDRHWYLGDWATPEGIDPRDPRSIDLVGNCVMSHAYLFMEKIAKVLGHDDDAAMYAQRHESHNELIHKTFYNNETGLYSTGTQIDMAYPLLVGATPDPLRETVTEALCRETEGRFTGHLSAGLVGVPVVTQWATMAGEAEFMYGMLKKRDYPGYLYMLDNGADTTWEYWDGKKSQIHNCYNGIGTWFYQALAGIIPDEENPGFSHVFIRPQPVEGITWVKAHKNTPYGRLSVGWSREDSSFAMEIEIPVGSTATICLPDNSVPMELSSGRHSVKCSL